LSGISAGPQTGEGTLNNDFFQTCYFARFFDRALNR
jgi:hypothetical protein